MGRSANSLLPSPGSPWHCATQHLKPKQEGKREREGARKAWFNPSPPARFNSLIPAHPPAGSQSVVPRRQHQLGDPPTSSLEMQNLGLHLRSIKSEMNDKWVHFIQGNEVAIRYNFRNARIHYSTEKYLLGAGVREQERLSFHGDETSGRNTPGAGRQRPRALRGGGHTFLRAGNAG